MSITVFFKRAISCNFSGSYLKVKNIIYLILISLSVISLSEGSSAASDFETELAGIKLGMLKANVIEILGEPEEDTFVVTPRTGNVYDFMNYPTQGILVVLEDSIVSMITISNPCEARTLKGLGLGDELSKAKELYGKGIKEALGDVSKFLFVDYNISIKGLKGTVIISEITLGNIDIY